jgi:hypothetical protein
MILGLSLCVDFQPIQFFRCRNKEVNSSSIRTGGPISLDFFFLPPPSRTPSMAVRQISTRAAANCSLTPSRLGQRTQSWSDLLAGRNELGSDFRCNYGGSLISRQTAGCVSPNSSPRQMRISLIDVTTQVRMMCCRLNVIGTWCHSAPSHLIRWVETRRVDRNWWWRSFEFTRWSWR